MPRLGSNRIRRSTLYSLPAKCPWLAFILVVCFASTAACAAMVAFTGCLIVAIDQSIHTIVGLIAVFPDFVTWISFALWRTAWVACLVACALCALFNLIMVGSLVYMLARRLWCEELLPFYAFFREGVQTRFHEELRRERLQEERVARAVLERALCADVAGIVTRFAGFYEVKRARRGVRVQQRARPRCGPSSEGSLAAQ